MSVRASTPRLGSDFYGRGARQVAQDLLGTILVRCIGEEIVSGLIVEVEAYCDSDERDLACHGDKANSGKPTKRTKLMFGPPGFAYVYFTYGMHWMLNFVTGKNSEANAVLKHYETIFHNATNGIFRVNANGELITANSCNRVLRVQVA